MRINLKELFYRIWKDPVWSKIIAASLIALGGAFWIWLSSIKSNKAVEKTEKEVFVDSGEKSVTSEGKLPYLENVALLDKTIYIRYSYNDFVIGGKNISKLKIAARTSDGGNAQFNVREAPLEIEYRIHDKPYIEFEYGSNLYSIEVSGTMYDYRYMLKGILKLTMDLEKIPSK